MNTKRGKGDQGHWETGSVLETITSAPLC